MGDPLFCHAAFISNSIELIFPFLKFPAPPSKYVSLCEAGLILSEYHYEDAISGLID
jgi:hypothetical protein